MSLLPKELIREIVKKGNFNTAADIQEVCQRVDERIYSGIS